MQRPNSEHGIHIDGPLTVEDWRIIMGDIEDLLADEKCDARDAQRIKTPDGEGIGVGCLRDKYGRRT
jgi:hypothetical protein